MYKVMKQFIETKYYESEEVAKRIIKSFNTTDDLAPEEYEELCLLAREVYSPYVPPVVDEPTVIPEVL